MNKEKYMNNDSTILFGVPKVEYGAFGGNTPFPICLKACSDYLGEMMEYSQIMVNSAAAFRFVWNEKKWDLSNVDIYHTFEESNDIYGIGARALGREFDWLCREQATTKEEFISFIKEHLDEGYPCIALGIIGPPEACLITGYREKGEVLLGWNFFQNDPDFAGSVEQDECGYFISRTWWENTDTQAVKYFGRLASVEEDASKQQRYIRLEKLFGEIAETMGQMQSMFGNWEKMDQMLENLASDSVRKKACGYIDEAARWDGEALQILSEMIV